MIDLVFPDGSSRQYPDGSTGLPTLGSLVEGVSDEPPGVDVPDDAQEASYFAASARIASFSRVSSCAIRSIYVP